MMGMAIILQKGRQIPKGHRRVNIVCSAAAAGSTTLRAAALRFAAGSFPTSGTATAGSGLFCIPVRREAGGYRNFSEIEGGYSSISKTGMQIKKSDFTK